MSTFKERYEERKKNRESQETTSSFKDRYMARQIESGKFDSNEITSRIDTWFKNHNNYINNYNSRYSTRKGTYEDSYVSDSGEWLDTISAQKSNFDKEASAIMSYLDQYGDYFGKEYTDSVKNAFQSALGQQSEILKQASSDKDFWSLFADENEYIDYQREAKKQKRYEGYQQKYAGMSYEDILAATNKLMGDEEKEWLNTYKYDLVKSASDYDSRSATGWESYLADEENKLKAQADAKADEKWYEKIGRWYGNAGYGDTSLPMGNIGQITDDLRKDTSASYPSDTWNEEQKAIFGYLYANDKTDAYNYANYTNEMNNRAANDEAIAGIEKWATKNPALATVASIGMMPFSLADTMSMLTEYNATGSVSTSATPLPGQVSNAITSAIANTLNQKSGTLNEKIPVIGGKGLGDVYQLGTSIANSMITGYTQGALGTYMVFFGSASASGIYDAKKRGATDDQALTFGIINGLAEAAGEAFSVDHLLSMTGVGELKNFFFEVLKQAGIEALEEGTTTLINNLAEQFVMSDKSNFNILVSSYKTDGKMSEEEAKKAAWKSMANDLVYDMLGGFISGGVSGGLQGGIQTGIQGMQNAAQGKEYKNTYGADIGTALAGEAVEISPDSKFAQRMQTKAEAGKELSNRQVGKLVQQNETAMYENDAETIKTAAASRLTKLGESGNIDVIASALTKQVTGERLTFAEREAVKSSKFGKRVANELNPENIRSGGYSSAWAEKIGTDRINAAEYGKMIAELEHDATTPKHLTLSVNPPEEPEEEAGATGSEDVGIKVKEISSVKDGKITVKLDSGEVVDASDVDFGNEDTALVYQAAAEMSQRAGYNEDTVKVLVNGFESSGLNAAEYLHAFRDSFNYGAAGTVSVSALEKGKYTSLLSEKQRELAFHLGKAFGEESAQRAEQERARIENEKTASAEKEANAVKTSGEVIFDGSVNQGSLSKAQKAQIKVLQGVSSAVGAKIRLFASEATVTEDGRRTRVFSSADGEAITANGWYDNETGEIWIDVNAGVDGNGLILFTAAHESTHFIKDWSSEKYNAFANFLISQYAENGVSVDELIEAQIEKAAKRGREMTREEAFDEVVADSCESFLTDSNAAEKIAALNEKDATLAEKIKSYIHKLLVKIRNLLNGIDPDSEEGKIVRGMTDSLEQLYELWTDALADAGQNYGQADMGSEKGSVQYSERYQSAEENPDILSLAKKVESGNFKANDKVYLGVVSEKLAKKIESLTGINVDGFKVAIEARQMVHILKDHGKNGKADRSMADLSDIAKMEYTLNNYDNINAAGRTLAYSYMVNGKNRTAPTVLYEKAIGEKSYYVVQAVPETKTKTLFIVTAFIGNSGYKKEVSQLINAKSPDATSEFGSATTSGSIISHLDGSVNSKSKKFSERDTASARAAVSEFGTTSDFSHAGFAIFDGRMLKLSQYGQAGVKHRNIERIYADTKGDDAIARFIQEGNVRISAASPGVEMSADIAPTVSQLNTISRFISNSLRNRGVFYLDITDSNGENAVSIAYDEDATTSDIVYDIKDYYERGRIPQRVYSERDPDAISSREVLANALESTVQNDIEAERLAEYKSKIPYEVDKTQVVRDITNMDSLQQTINSYGILQDTQKNAPQALIITGLNNMVDRHIDQVGSVYGLAIPVRNFNKIWNIRESAVDGGQGKPITVVQGVIEENWGADGKKFIEQMVTDLQGARKNTRSELERKIESGYIGATFALNLSVVMKQIGSLYTANSELDRSRAGVGMLANLAYTMAHFDKLAAEVDKYTAAVYNRRQGLSDNEVHTFITQAKKSGISRALNKLPAGINPTKWITFMDASVALSLWKYVKADVAKSTKLKGEELLKETAKRFDSLIENTQSMSDVLHKPEIQKRQDVFSKSFAMFKTDLYQSAGQLRVMAGRYQANKSDANKKALTRTVVSIARSAAWNSLMTTLFALLRYKVNPYRDDEEELTPESWLKRQGVMLAGDFAGYLFPIFGSEIVGLIENVIYGESEEAVDSLALTLVNDLVDSITTIGNAITEGEMPDASEWENLLMKSAQLLGIPLSNIKRTVKAIRLHAEDIANGEFLSFEAGANKTDAKQLYDAVISGNDKRIDKAEALFDDQKAIDSALRKGLRENDVRIKAAARMLNAGDIRGFADFIETISGEGVFDGETVEAAIRAEASAFNSKIKDAAEAKRDGKTDDYIKIVKELRESYRGVYTQDEIVEVVNSYTFEDVVEDDVEEVESVYKNSDINAALESGDTETASEIIKELIEVKTENNFLKAQREADESGKRFKEKEARTRAELDARSSIRSSLTNYWKKRYIAAYESGNEAEINRISELLYSTGIYGNRKKYLDEVLEGWLEK